MICIFNAYIDDMYLQGNAKTKCVSNIVAIIKKLGSLGFTIHAGKSNLIPTLKLDVLRFTIDSVAMTVSLKETNKKDLRNLISGYGKVINVRLCKDYERISVRTYLVEGKLTKYVPKNKPQASYCNLIQ